MIRGAWSDEEKEWLRTMKLDGLPNEVIAVRMGRSLSSIRRRVAKHNRIIRRRKAALDVQQPTP